MPARLTLLIQPCDIDAFRDFKVVLEKAYHECQASSEVETIEAKALLRCFYDAIEHKLNDRARGAALDLNGLGQQLKALTQRVLRSLALDAMLVLPAGEPTAAPLVLCLPKRRACLSERCLRLYARLW